eukprot:g2399.t1
MSNVAVPRQALTVLAVAPIRWANLLNLAEEFLYVPDHRRYSRGGSFWVFHWQQEFLETEAWFDETLQMLDLLRRHADGETIDLETYSPTVDVETGVVEGLSSARALFWRKFRMNTEALARRQLGPVNSCGVPRVQLHGPHFGGAWLLRGQRPADMELGVGGSRSLDSAFFEQSQTWRYVTGDISTREVWEVCLKRTAALGTQLHDEGLISKEDLQSLEPFLFIGLPAAAVVRLVVRSINKDGLDFEELKVTSDNRPHNAFADSIWQTAMRAKQAAEDAQPISDVEMKQLDEHLRWCCCWPIWGLYGFVKPDRTLIVPGALTPTHNPYKAQGPP